MRRAPKPPPIEVEDRTNLRGGAKEVVAIVDHLAETECAACGDSACPAHVRNTVYAQLTKDHATEVVEILLSTINTLRAEVDELERDLYVREEAYTNATKRIRELEAQLGTVPPKRQTRAR